MFSGHINKMSPLCFLLPKKKVVDAQFQGNRASKYVPISVHERFEEEVFPFYGALDNS